MLHNELDRFGGRLCVRGGLHLLYNVLLMSMHVLPLLHLTLQYFIHYVFACYPRDVLLTYDTR